MNHMRRKALVSFPDRGAGSDFYCSSIQHPLHLVITGSRFNRNNGTELVRHAKISRVVLNMLFNENILGIPELYDNNYSVSVEIYKYGRAHPSHLN